MKNSKTFPLCDGSHVAHNKATGDNLGLRCMSSTEISLFSYCDFAMLTLIASNVTFSTINRACDSLRRQGCNCINLNTSKSDIATIVITAMRQLIAISIALNYNAQFCDTKYYELFYIAHAFHMV